MKWYVNWPSTVQRCQSFRFVACTSVDKTQCLGLIWSSLQYKIQGHCEGEACKEERQKGELEWERSINTVFSLNFSSASKGTFMAGKAKNMPQRCNFLRGEGGGVREWSERHGLTLRGAKFFETSFPHFLDLFYANRPLISLHNNLKRIWSQ